MIKWLTGLYGAPPSSAPKIFSGQLRDWALFYLCCSELVFRGPHSDKMEGFCSPNPQPMSLTNIAIAS